MRKRRVKLWRALHRGALMVLGGLLVGLGSSVSDRLEADSPAMADFVASQELVRLANRVEELEGQLSVNELKVERLTRIGQYSAVYRIPANQAEAIYDAALAEGLHPSLGFQLVKVESGFRPTARSSKAAIGLTQVRLPTARELVPGITERQLEDTETNLRIGFRILRRLLRQFDNDLEMALRAYNLGPTGAVLSFADTTANARVAAYAERVMRGMKGGRATVTPTRGTD